MLKASLLTLLAHKARLVMTVLAVSLGVAFMSGTFTFTATLQHDLDSLFRAAAKGTDVVVRHAAPAGEAGGSAGERPAIPANLLDRIASVPGVAAADGVVVAPAQLTTHAGGLAGAGPGIATNWRPDVALDAAYPVRDGRPPQAADEVAIDQDSATKYVYQIGDIVRIVINGTARPFRVVGIVGYAGGNGPGRTLSIFAPATSPALFGKQGQYNEIDIKTAPGIAAATVRDRITAILPADDEAITSAAVASEQSASLKSDLGFLTDALAAFAGIALFVGGFVIWNTFGILVAGRTRELALLRAIGARRRQVFIAVLAAVRSTRHRSRSGPGGGHGGGGYARAKSRSYEPADGHRRRIDGLPVRPRQASPATPRLLTETPPGLRAVRATWAAVPFGPGPRSKVPSQSNRLKRC